MWNKFKYLIAFLIWVCVAYLLLEIIGAENGQRLGVWL